MWRVLYVEDNADARELVQIVFRDDGDELEIQCVETVQEAVDSIRGFPPDLYLLDSMLPDGNGLDLCRWIRSFDPYRPIAFVSANAFREDKWLAVAAGCDVYLTKPLDLGELREEVLRLLNSRKVAVRSGPVSN